MAMNRAEFMNGVLGRLGSYQVGAFRAFGAWIIAESGEERMDGVDGAKWNPFNTTQPWPNSTDYNAQHVKNYATYLDGVRATVATLNNGYYDNILALIRTDNVAAGDICKAIDASPWGTSAAEDALKEYQQSRSYFNGLLIGP